MTQPDPEALRAEIADRAALEDSLNQQLDALRAENGRLRGEMTKERRRLERGWKEQLRWERAENERLQMEAALSARLLAKIESLEVKVQRAKTDRNRERTLARDLAEAIRYHKTRPTIAAKQRLWDALARYDAARKADTTEDE